MRQTTDDPYVRSDITPLSAKVEGYVRRVPVNDFQQAAWLNTGLTHDWVGDDFLQSDLLLGRASPRRGESHGKAAHRKGMPPLAFTVRMRP
jgi:hypothetical protein